jgi:hypothetical protein
MALKQRARDIEALLQDTSVFAPVCPFCMTPSNDNKCKNCGAYMPQAHFTGETPNPERR